MPSIILFAFFILSLILSNNFFKMFFLEPREKELAFSYKECPTLFLEHKYPNKDIHKIFYILFGQKARQPSCQFRNVCN